MGSLKIGLSKIVVVVAIVLVVVVVVGVWAYYVQQQGASKKLVVLARSGTYAEGLKIAAEEYQKRTGVEVVVQELGYKELHDKLAMEVIQKTGAYDVVMLDDPWLAEFASQGFLEDIGGMLEAKGVQVDPDFVPTTIEVCKYKGKLYALPYVGNVQLFVYREDLFEKYGLPEPKTWDDVLKAAKTIYEGERGKVYGYVIRGKKGNPVVTNFLPIFWGYGARIVDETGRPTVYSDAAIKALKTFLELKDYAPPGVENYNSPEIKAALYNGQTAMSNLPNSLRNTPTIFSPSLSLTFVFLRSLSP
ncbi:MAG TPA: extracellular solute-binding protein, partial [Pyrodictiaceae archaeon]|nr:extracellular solute-binding protein [Pyrodictiaceae archaeon]